MVESLPIEEAARILYHEALALDEKRWDDWLAMYAEDAIFWIPGWTDEHRLASDPDRELSLMYHSARVGLADRVMRLRSGLSVASKVLPRTVHSVGNVMWAEGGMLSSAFQVAVYDLKSKSTHVWFGRYEHRLRKVNGEWRIAAKKVILANDLIPTMLDFYSV